MQEEINAGWTAGSSEYDDIVNRQLKDRKEVAYWQQELTSQLGSAPLDVLDLGCGPGFFSIMLGKLGHRVTSLDGAEGMVNVAQKNLAASGTDAKLYCGNAVTLSEESNESADAIVSRDVVWTLYDPAAAYRRWLEVLRPGGVVLVYDGNYRRDRPGLKRSLWFAFSRVLVRITEGKQNSDVKADNHDSDLDYGLPAVTQERPALDLRLLKEAGFEDISAEWDKHRNSFFNLEYLKYGYQGRKFRVIARKPR